MEEVFIIQNENFQLTQLEFFIRMLVAVGIGFLIGLEREHSSRPVTVEVFAGVRTFVFVVLFGFLLTFLGQFFTHWIVIAGLVMTGMIVAVYYWVSSQRGRIGGTTEFATLIAFILGVTTFLGFLEESLAITVVVLVILSLKLQLRDLIGQISQVEMFALIKFVVLVLLIFPFLPDRTVDPFDIFNPRELGWIIILISGIGFAGYLLMKFVGGEKGILMTGILGGIVSSTVTTWVFSKKSKEIPELSRKCAVAIFAASTIMIIRVFAWVFIFNKPLLDQLAIPIVLIFITGLGVAIYYHLSKDHDAKVDTDFPLGEPLNLKGALVFGLLYTVILFVVSYANEQFGATGIYVTSGIAGLTDINAITISISKLAGDTIAVLNAQNAILLATLSNTVIKITISLWAGSKGLRRYIFVGYGLIFLSGLIGFIILN